MTKTLLAIFAHPTEHFRLADVRPAPFAKLADGIFENVKRNKLGY
jgi:hypothetical protein